MIRSIRKKKFFITTTVPQTLFFFTDQCSELERTFDVTAVSTDNELLRKFGRQEGIRVKGIRMEREISLVRDLISLFRWIILLIKARPYVVHANTPKASLLAMTAAWLTRRPIRIYMCHGLRYQGCTGKKRKLLIMMERIACRCANRVICVSQGVRLQFAKDAICSLEKSSVILRGSVNGVDTERFAPDIVDDTEIRERYAIRDDDYNFLFVGRMVSDKGINELISVVCRLYNEGFPVRLMLVGGRERQLDALLPKTEELIKKNRSFITECGRQADVRPFIKATDVLVLPSYREGFGQVLVEANAMERPVVVSRIVGCSDVVEEGVNGLYCEPRNEDSLYTSMKRMMTDKPLYTKMKEHSRPYVIQHFEHKLLLNHYISYYKAID